MSACCEGAGNGKTLAMVRGVREAVAWIFPCAVVVALPKCPACLAAHVALWTGLGMSFSTASYLRWALLSVCAASLTFLIVKRLNRVRAHI